MFSYLDLLRQRQIESARFDSFFLVFRYAFCIYSIVMPLIDFFMNENPGISGEWRDILNFTKNQELSPTKQTSRLIILNASVAVFPVILALFLMLLLVIMFSCFGKSYVSMGLGIGVQSHMYFWYFFLLAGLYKNLKHLLGNSYD